MFNKILMWIREVWRKMINPSEVKKTLQIEVAISQSMATALELWSKIYEGKPSWVINEIVSMNLGSAIASEIARTASIEMKVEVSGGARAVWLTDAFADTLENIRAAVEYGAAKGGLMFKPYIDGKKELVVDFVQADQFYPVAFDANGRITSCIFSDQRVVGNHWYTRLEFHNLTDTGYVIMNQAFQSESKDVLGNKVPLETVDAWADLVPLATITGIDKPMFGYFKYPLANTIDPSSPLGVSCYSRATDLIKQADIQWSDFLWEFESGRRALYVDELAFGKDPATGKPFVPNKRLYKTLAGAGNLGDEELFKEWTPDFRETNILNGLEAILRRIEFNCGLAYGTLSNTQFVDKTATEIKTSRQRSYATITDVQKSLQTALDDLFYAMDTWASLFNLAPTGSYEVTYTFDDSVIVDTDVQFQQDMRLVGAGLMSKVEFRMRNFNEDEATAKRKVAEAKADQPKDIFDQVGI